MTPQRPSDVPDQWLGKTLTMQIDRPLGSRHPEHPDILYTVNYGYIPGTKAADGAAIDAYLLGVAQPVSRYEGRCIAILHRLTDIEDKLVIAPPGTDPCDAQILQATRFQERFFSGRLLR